MALIATEVTWHISVQALIVDAIGVTVLMKLTTASIQIAKV
ncbi:hypothetical protein BMETH_31761492701116, partial [methanotrophic bacterial endosymbiont of Bathymodiolus sp.]